MNLLAAGVTTMSTGRISAIVAGMLALTGVVLGGLALARSRRRVGDHGRRGAVVALALALGAVLIGATVVVTADGGLGTGNGLGGGVVAMVGGLLGLVVGGVALARSRRAAGPVRSG